MKTNEKNKPTRTKEWLRKRMDQEAKSFAHYSGGNPMRAIIGKRYENARARYLAA